MHVQVVQAIGAAEAELLNWGLPKRIDGDGAINLIKAAEDCGVTQYLQVLRLIMFACITLARQFKMLGTSTRGQASSELLLGVASELPEIEYNWHPPGVWDPWS